MRNILGKLPKWDRYNLAVVLGLVVVGLAIPQIGLAQVPNISGNWTGTLNVSSSGQSIASSASLSSSSTAVSGSIQTNNPRLASSSVGSTNERTLQPQAACAGCAVGPATTDITLVFNNFTVNLSGTIDGSNFANGSFNAADNAGNSISGSASGTVTSTSVSMNFSGTDNTGKLQSGTLTATSDNPPPPPPPDPGPCGGAIVCVL